MSEADEPWEFRRDPDVESRRLGWVSSLRRDPDDSDPPVLADAPPSTDVIDVAATAATGAIATAGSNWRQSSDRSLLNGAIRQRRSPRRRRRRRVSRIAVGVLTVVLGYVGVNFWQVWRTGLADEARAVDAIVVLGAAQYDGRPSPQLAARLDHAADLYRFGIAPLVVVTGGNRPGDRFTEASASADYLAERGVPVEALLLEDRGRSTWESLDAVDALLDDRGLNSVVVVTDPYHSLRSRLTAEEAGLVAYASPTRSSPVRGRGAWWREAKEAVGVSAGRLIGFERLSRLTD